MHIPDPGFPGGSVAQRSRRALAGLLGAAAVSLAGVGVARAKKKKPKKAKLCLNGQTVSASKKKRKKLIEQGAAPGACCAPQCNGTSCGGADGCGGVCGCGAGAVCHGGVCKACTVTCSGTDIACGLALTAALAGGGEVVACPGRYAGNFTMSASGSSLIGAGPGEDPAANTILDGKGSGSVISVDFNVPVLLSGLRVTGGAEILNVSGGCGIYAFSGDLQVDNFSVVDNQGATGGGIMGTKRLRLSNGTIERNIAKEAGGGVYWSAESPSSIQNVYVANNVAVTGGGVYHTGSQMTIAGCEISENRATGKGGGVYEFSGTLTLDAATRIVENRAPGGGGGVWNDGGTLQRNNAVISGNTPDNCRGAGCA